MFISPSLSKDFIKGLNKIRKCTHTYTNTHAQMFISYIYIPFHTSDKIVVGDKNDESAFSKKNRRRKLKYYPNCAANLHEKIHV